MLRLFLPFRINREGTLHYVIRFPITMSHYIIKLHRLIKNYYNLTRVFSNMFEMCKILTIYHQLTSPLTLNERNKNTAGLKLVHFFKQLCILSLCLFHLRHQNIEYAEIQAKNYQHVASSSVRDK